MYSVEVLQDFMFVSSVFMLKKKSSRFVGQRAFVHALLNDILAG